MKRRILAGVMLAAFCFAAPLTEAAARVPENVYQWVQSSARADYYFNKEQICYGKTSLGYVDLNTLIVPTIKMYDDLLIQDVQDKRRWKMLPLDGYDALIGSADYLRFDLAAHQVQVTESDYLDRTWSTLDAVYSKQPVDINTLPEKSLDRSFYKAILEYEKLHRDEIIQHTHADLSPLDKKKLAAEKAAAEKAAKEQAKKQKHQQKDE